MYHVEECKMQEIRGMFAACKFFTICIVTGAANKHDADYFGVLLDRFEQSLDSIPYKGGE